MERFIEILWTNSISMSLVIIIVFAMNILLSKKYSARWRYNIWIIVVLGLLVPFRPRFINTPIKIQVPFLITATTMPSSGTSNRTNNSSVPLVSDPRMNNFHEPSMDTAEPAVQEKVQTHGISVHIILVCAWFIGFMLFVLLNFYKHIKIIKMVKRWGKTCDSPQMLLLVSEVKEKLGISNQVSLKTCEFITIPAMIGLVRPIIIMPCIESNMKERELELILRHELLHYKRKDLWYKTLVMLANAVHWFNPLVHWMARVIALDCEVSCDEAVSKDMDFNDRKYYAETLIGVIKANKRMQTAFSTHFCGGKNDMKKRLFSIMDMNKKVRAIAAICCVCTLSFTLILGAAYAKDSINPSEVNEMQKTDEPVNNKQETVEEKTSHDDVVIEKAAKTLFAMNVGRSIDFMDEVIKNSFFTILEEPIVSESNGITMALSHYILTDEHSRFVFKIDGLSEDIEPDKINVTGEYTRSPNISIVNIEMILKDKQGDLIYERNLPGKHMVLMSGLFETPDGIFLEAVIDTPDSDMRLIGNLEIPDILSIEVNEFTLFLKENLPTSPKIKDTDINSKELPMAQVVSQSTMPLQIKGKWDFTLNTDEKFKNVNHLYYETTNPKYCDKNGIYVENFYSSAMATRMELIIDNSKNDIQLPSGDLGFVLFEDENTKNYKNPYEQKLFVIADGEQLFETAEYIPYEGYEGEKMYTMKKLVSEDKRHEQTNRGTKYFLYLPTLYFAKAEHLTVRVLDKNRDPLEVNLKLIKE